jgi:signal transduction histidine kinase
VTNLLYLASTTSGLPSLARERLADADAELQRVAHITRQALGFYRESNAVGAVRLSALIDDAVGLLKIKIEAKHVEVERQFHETQDITAVAGELRQVFLNLIVNAVEAVGEQGKIKIRVRRCALKDDRPAVRITFSDNGSGIEIATLSRILNRSARSSANWRSTAMTPARCPRGC